MNLLRFLRCMTNEAGLSSVLSAAFSLKHATDMKKSISSLVEAQEKAKNTRLTREQIAKCIRETPHEHFAVYDAASGLTYVRPDDFQRSRFPPVYSSSTS